MKENQILDGIQRIGLVFSSPATCATVNMVTTLWVYRQSTHRIPYAFYNVFQRAATHPEFIPDPIGMLYSLLPVDALHRFYFRMELGVPLEHRSLVEKVSGVVMLTSHFIGQVIRRPERDMCPPPP